MPIIKQAPFACLLLFCFLYSYSLPADPSRGIYSTSLFDLSTPFPSPCDNPAQKCYTIKEMVDASLRKQYESRQAVEQLFQAKTAIKLSVSAIAPHFNLGMAYNDYFSFNPAITTMDLASNFVGFLFPNRWFNWKANKILVDAEIEGMKSLYANQVLVILNTYYSIQNQIWQFRVHQHYIDALQQLLDVLHRQNDAGMRTESNKIRADDLAILENFKARLVYNLAYIDNLSATYPYLAYAMALDFSQDWSDLVVAPDHIKKIGSLPLGRPQEYYQLAEENSSELANVRDLLKAARLNKKSNFFDIFDPAAGVDFGLGYPQRIKLSKANIKILEIQLERTLAQIRISINKSLNNYNDSIIALNTLEPQFALLPEVVAAVVKNVNNVGEPFDCLKAARYFETAYFTYTAYVSSYYLLKANAAGLERATWRNPYFQQVLDYAKNYLPETYQIVKKTHSLKFKFLQKIKSWFGAKH
jgi:hypothetical protein